MTDTNCSDEMNRRYPDRPERASDGEEFAQHMIRLYHDLMGEDVGYYTSSLDQLTLGESAAGIEFKHLQASFRTGRLHIEVGERTSIKVPWKPSGIFAWDMKFYCCGTFEDAWTFNVNDLRERVGPDADWYHHETCVSMVLRKVDALPFYLHRFRRIDGRYVLFRNQRRRT